jgi:hypothetical protein
MVASAAKWITFGVILSLLPLLIAALIDVSLRENLNATDYLLRGDLYVIACVLCMTSIGELSDRDFRTRERKSVKHILLVLAGLFAMIDAALYGCVYGLLKAGDDESLRMLADASMWHYLAAAVASTLAVLFSKAAE